MSARARVGVLALAAASALVLGGCVPGEPTPTASSEPSATPVFASEQEALAAATDAYAAYSAASDQITGDAGASPERIDEFVTASYKKVEDDGFAEFRSSGNHTTGPSKFDSIRFQQFDADIAADEVMTVYLCYDVSEVRLIAPGGADITPVDRPDRVPLEVDLRVAKVDEVQLLIDRSEVWSGQNFC